MANHRKSIRVDAKKAGTAPPHPTIGILDVVENFVQFRFRGQSIVDGYDRITGVQISIQLSAIDVLPVPHNQGAAMYPDQNRCHTLDRGPVDVGLNTAALYLLESERSLTEPWAGSLQFPRGRHRKTRCAAGAQRYCPEEPTSVD